MHKFDTDDYLLTVLDYQICQNLNFDSLGQYSNCLKNLKHLKETKNLNCIFKIKTHFTKKLKAYF